MARVTRTDPRLDLAAAATCVVAALVCLALPATTRDAVAGALRSSLMAPLLRLQERAELGRRTLRGHDVAAQVADSVALRALRLTGIEQENAHLRGLLGLGAALRWGFVPAEALGGRGVGDDPTMLISVGRREGIEPLSPVVTPDGLLGVVDRVDANLSTVILWQHPDFRVSAMSTNGDAYGMVQAHGGSGANRFFLEMRGVLLRAQLKPGDVIVTSGLGGVYPRGIPVGTVVSELRTPDQWARSYLVRPAVPLSEAGSVLVLSRERADAGVPNVWASAVGADSAARRVVAAIDSIARLTGDSNTVRQRRAPMDTARARAGVPGRRGP
ncbi:MAG TPA: rod shape-determining protein MreC [Gemmatimonadaceae bacterium]|nr:rod shape-determining protein MreC [Gemmatimonadaceae bacterium]